MLPSPAVIIKPRKTGIKWCKLAGTCVLEPGGFLDGASVEISNSSDCNHESTEEGEHGMVLVLYIYLFISLYPQEKKPPAPPHLRQPPASGVCDKVINVITSH